MPVIRLFTACLASCALFTGAAAAQDFVPAPTSPEPPGLRDPMALVSADFNKDGRADLAYIDGSAADPSNVYANSVAVSLAGAGGDFSPPVTFSLPTPYVGAVAYDLTVGKFDGDGHYDLAVAQSRANPYGIGARVALLVGDGSGNFTQAGSSNPGVVGPPSLAAGTFNADTLDDLYIVGGIDGHALLADGVGGFIVQSASQAGQCEVGDVAAGDFNSDGEVDVAVSDESSCSSAVDGAVKRWHGVGDGTFTSAGPRTKVQESVDSAGQLFTAQANGDAHADILNVGFAAPTGSGTTVLTSDGGGGIAPLASGPLYDQHVLAVGDLSGDPISDVVASYNVSGGGRASCVKILDGQASGVFAATSFGPELVGGRPLSAATGDFDFDGDRDVAVGFAGSSVGAADGVAILLNQRVPGGAGANAGATCDATGAPVAGDYTPPPDTTPPPPGGGDSTPPPGGGGGQQPPPAPEPEVTGPAGNPLGLPTRRRCVDTRKFSFKLHHAPGARIVKVEVFINGKRKMVKRGTNITKLTLKRLPKKKFRVRIVATQNTGSKLISVRTYKGCKKSRARTRRGGRRR